MRTEEELNAKYRAWKKANAEKLSILRKARYRANYEKEKAQKKAWIEANPGRAEATRKSWGKANRGKINAQHRAWCRTNPEKVNAYGKAWREANPEKVRARNKRGVDKYIKTHPERVRAQRKAYVEANPEKVKEQNRKSSSKRKALSLGVPLHKLKSWLLYPEDVKSFFTRRFWPYTTSGKEEVTDKVIKIISGSFDSQVSTLTMPHYGRELNAFKDANILSIEDAIGVEKNRYIFYHMQRVFYSFFPGIKLIQQDINEYIQNERPNVDFTHIDLNGPLTDQVLDSLRILQKTSRLTQITFQSNWRFDVGKGHMLLDRLYNEFNVEFEDMYEGKKKVEMSTLLLA